MFGLKSKSQRAELLEYRTNGVGKVDKEAGIIFGVRILGKESANGRSYSDRAMNDATRMYESAKVNIDHPAEHQRERGFGDGFGELRNVRREGDAVIGDLHYVRSHPMAPLILEYAERFPRQFGLSHHADGRVSRKGGKVIVESVEVVHSVDIVGCPATNRGLFESVNFHRNVATLPKNEQFGMLYELPQDTQGKVMDMALGSFGKLLKKGLTEMELGGEETVPTMADLSEDELAIVNALRSDAAVADKWKTIEELVTAIIGEPTATGATPTSESLRRRLATQKPAIRPVSLRESAYRLPANGERINFRSGLAR